MGHLHGRLIAFDLDGTLIDSRRDLSDSVNALILERGGAVQSEEAIGRMVGEGAGVLVARALRASGLESEAAPGAFERNLQRFLQIYDGRLLNHTRPYDGILDVVAAARRCARVAVLTNKPARATGAVLDGLGLRHLFDDVIGSGGEWPRKPDPASLRELMSRAGSGPDRTLLVGDSAIDHETAARAGTRCCVAAYGFGFVNFPRERLKADDCIVHAPGELIPIFEAFSEA